MSVEEWGGENIMKCAAWDRLIDLGEPSCKESNEEFLCTLGDGHLYECHAHSANGNCLHIWMAVKKTPRQVRMERNNRNEGR
jgi:hypothetical protein